MNPAVSVAHSDAAFFRNRQAMLVYPAIILPFLAVLFWLLGGGKGERDLSEEIAATKPGATGFNASMPNAKGGNINGREVEKPGYGKATTGQVLSSFTHTRSDSAMKGIQAMPAVSQTLTAGHSSSLRTTPEPIVVASTNPTSATRNRVRPIRTSPSRSASGYYYNAPKGSQYYAGSDQQLNAQLRSYENASSSNQSRSQTSTSEAPPASNPDARPASVQLSDNLTASRLAEPLTAENAFHTAPTGGSRAQPTRAVLSGGNGYGNRKAISWMIPVVVHEDQTIKDGQQVKLRLLKEVQADGVTIPTNTILYAICQLSDDRLRLTVRSLQLGGQLIPLDLDVYDTDGSAGINVPGLSQSSQVNGQIRSSAIQGVQLPGIGGLANNVVNSARMGASQSVRQSTIRLRAGYNLFLKAQ